MNIAFDAKRAYHNGTGLGYYSRVLIKLLSEQYPQHHYFLFNPKAGNKYSVEGVNLQEVLPASFFHRLFSSAWRSSWVKGDLKKNKIDLYHGLSHEIPLGIQHTGIRSVVTIHDLIHERFPEQYNPVDVRIYHKKFSNACRQADRIIAISEQTKSDIIEFYKTPPEKIVVCIQSCSPEYAVMVTEEMKEQVRKQYGLPREFFLYVGSIIERKNLLNICKAFKSVYDELPVPLVVIGDGGKYKEKVKEYIAAQGLRDRILFLSERPEVKNDPAFRTPARFAAIYQSALAMIYPSYFEGFGAPVMEALWSRLPVITSNVSCLPEAGGDAAWYVNPGRPEEIAGGMRKIYSDKLLADSMREKGRRHAEKYSPEKYAASVMSVYQDLW